jgi:ribonuclease VapC
LILDTSAIAGVIFRERGHHRLETLMEDQPLAIGAPTLVEATIVMVRKFDLHGRALLAQFLEHNRVLTLPFAAGHWQLAAEAFIRYGKGRHPAALNYGDCMTYATAKLAEAPLLFVGEDFAKTDLQAALA